ncbi:recombinase family protein, partial [Nocardioides pakistanensis]
MSKERDGMVSPEVQRVAISDYCKARGYVLGGCLEGLDESGSRARSAWWPRLEQAVAQVEAGAVDVVVVWKYSRVARNRLRWATAVDRVETAGGRIESATEQVDTTTSTGRFTRGMLAELQAFEAERIGEVWREVHARRVRSGRPATGREKYGYRYDRGQQLHVPDPVTGPVLAELYRRYVAGESIYQLVRWMNAHGHRTLDDGLWSDRSLRRVLDSGFASGRFAHLGELVAGVHEPLIDDALWQAYLDARQSRRARPARVERSQYLLSGLVRCGRCGGAMVAGQYGARHEPKYRCRTGKEQGPEACTGGYVMASFVEGEVLAWLREVADEVEAVAGATSVADARKVTLRSEAERLAREVARVDEALQRLVVQRAESPQLPASVFDAALGELGERRAGLVGALEEAQRAERAAVSDPAAVARGLLEDWWTAPVEHRRELLRSLVDRVEVVTGR